MRSISMKSWIQCESALYNSRTNKRMESRKVANNTYLVRKMGTDDIALRYHNTEVVVWSADGILTLNSGGWQTLTTKKRISWCLPHGVRLYQEKGVWIIKVGGYGDDECKLDEAPRANSFLDGMTIYENRRNGKSRFDIIGAGPDPKAQRKLKQKVNIFSTIMVNKLISKELEVPSGGDCWYCHMVSTENPNETMGDLSSSTSSEHLISHMDERYYVPSLLLNAVREFNDRLSIAAKWIIQEWISPDSEDVLAEHYETTGGIAGHQIKRVMELYMCKRLGLAV